MIVVFSGVNCVPGARPASSMTLIPFNGDILCIAYGDNEVPR